MKKIINLYKNNELLRNLVNSAIFIVLAVSPFIIFKLVTGIDPQFHL
jgi:hypothetical protein